MQFLKNLWSDEKGEDVAEYALVLGLVAVAAIAGITIVGTSLGDWWSGLGDYIGGLTVPV